MKANLIRKRFGTVLLALLVCAAIGLATSAAATETTPPSVHTLTININTPDPNNPGAFVPVEGMPVQLKRLDLIVELSATTDENGQATFPVNLDGLAIAYLPVPGAGGDPDVWAPFTVDEHPWYVVVRPEVPAYETTITLAPRQETPGTGGIRLQKLYYNYTFAPSMQEMLYPLLLDTIPTNMPAAQFVINRTLPGGHTPLNGYLGPDGQLTATLENAARFTPDENGQLLVHGLPPGEYLVTELGYMEGAGRWLAPPQLVQVEAGEVVFVHDAFINTEDSFTVVFEKVDSATGAPLGGAAFLVYRVVDGEKQYVSYHGQPVYGASMLPYYTTDRARAYVFRSNSQMISETAGANSDVAHAPLLAPGIFAVPNLEPGHTYYLSEIKAPTGYQARQEDLPFTQAQSGESMEQPGHWITNPVTNVLAADVMMFKKVLNLDNRDGTAYAVPLQGAGFMLIELYTDTHYDPETDTLVDNSLMRFVLSGADQSGQSPAFSENLTSSAFDELYSAFMGEQEVTQELELAFYRQLADDHLFYSETDGSLPLYSLPDNQEGWMYLLLEVDPPPGAWPGAATFAVRDGQIVDAFTGDSADEIPIITNELSAHTVFLRKTDATGALPLAGAQYVLRVAYEGLEGGMEERYIAAWPPEYYHNNDLLQQTEGVYQLTEDIGEAHRFVTDHNGALTIPGLLEYMRVSVDEHGNEDFVEIDRYSLFEVQPPNGYFIHTPEEHRFILKAEWQSGSMGGRSHHFHTIHDVNHAIAPVPVHVTAGKRVTDPEGNPLNLADFPSFQFELYHGDILLGTATSDAQGIIVFENVFLALSAISAEDLLKPTAFTVLERPHEQPIAGMAYDTTPQVLQATYVGGLLSQPGSLGGEMTGLLDKAPRAVAQNALHMLEDAPVAVNAIHTNDRYEAVPMQGAPMVLGQLSLAVTFPMGQKDLVFTNVYTAPTPTPTPTSTPAPTPAPDDFPQPTPAATPTRMPDPVPSYPTLEVPLTARKTLKNGSLNAGDFTFVLADAKGGVLAEVTNLQDGTVVFPSRTFSRAVSGYTYTITEKRGGDPRVTYDPTVYTVRITTTPSGGALKATVDVLKNGTPYAGDIVFTNQRSLPPTGDSAYRTMLLLTTLALGLGALAFNIRRRTTR